MYEDIIEIKGEGTGPTSIILAGVHGDEKSGVEAFQNLLADLKIESGKVFFGYGNPRAIQKNTRFTEANLNRMFKSDKMISAPELQSYEYSRAQFLKTYLDQAEALLDIHCSFTPQSQPFIICEPNGFEISAKLPVELVVTGFDTVEPGGTDYYMNSTGKIGICVETGYLGDPRSTTIAEESIISFLKARGHIESSRNLKLGIEPRKQNRMNMYELYLTKTNSFKLAKSFEDFELVSAGNLIGTDGNQKILAPKNSYILFARDRQAIGEEAFLLGEDI